MKKRAPMIRFDFGQDSALKASRNNAEFHRANLLSGNPTEIASTSKEGQKFVTENSITGFLP